VARGDFQATEHYAHETLLMVYRSGYPWGGVRALQALACAHALRGTWPQAEEALAMLVGVFMEAGPVIQAIVQVLRQLVRAYAATDQEAVQLPIAMLMQTMGTDTYALAPVCALVELGDLMAAPSLIELPYQVLSMAAERGVLFSSGWMFLLPRVLGVAATLNGWWEQAETYFQTALAVATRCDARPELGRTYLDYAHLLVTRGRLSDHGRAVELARQASAILQALDMRPFAARAEQLVAALQSRAGLLPWQHPSAPERFSEHEVTILLRSAQSRTNFLG
jgi:hypothetical protein